MPLIARSEALLQPRFRSQSVGLFLTLALIFITASTQQLKPQKLLPNGVPHQAQLLVADNTRQLVWLGTLGRLQAYNATSGVVNDVDNGLHLSMLTSSGVVLLSTGTLFFHVAVDRSDPRRNYLMSASPYSFGTQIVAETPELVDFENALFVHQGYVYFAALSNNETVIMKTDGGAPILVGSIPGARRADKLSPQGSRFAVFNGDLYFVSNSEAYGVEVFKANATGVFLAFDAVPGNSTSDAAGLTVIGTDLFYLSIEPTQVSIIKCCPGSVLQSLPTSGMAVGTTTQMVSWRDQYLIFLLPIGGLIDPSLEQRTCYYDFPQSALFCPFFDATDQSRMAGHLGTTGSNFWTFLDNSGRAVPQSMNETGVVQIYENMITSVDNTLERYLGAGVAFVRSGVSVKTIGNSSFTVSVKKDPTVGVSLFECRDDTLACTSIYDFIDGSINYFSIIWAQYDSSTLFFSAPTSTGLGIFRIDNAGVSGTPAIVTSTPLTIPHKSRFEYDMRIIRQFKQGNNPGVLIQTTNINEYAFGTITSPPGSATIEKTFPTHYSEAPTLELGPTRDSYLGIKCLDKWCITYSSNTFWVYNVLNNSTHRIFSSRPGNAPLNATVTKYIRETEIIHSLGIFIIFALPGASDNLEAFVFNTTYLNTLGLNDPVLADQLGFLDNPALAPISPTWDVISESNSRAACDDGRLYIATQIDIGIYVTFSVSVLPETFGEATRIHDADSFVVGLTCFNSSIWFIASNSSFNSIRQVENNVLKYMNECLASEFDWTNAGLYAAPTRGLMLAKVTVDSTEKALLVLDDQLGLFTRFDVVPYDKSIPAAPDFVGEARGSDGILRLIFLTQVSQAQFKFQAWKPDISGDFPLTILDSSMLPPGINLVNARAEIFKHPTLPFDAIILRTDRDLWFSDGSTAATRFYSTLRSAENEVGDIFIGPVNFHANMGFVGNFSFAWTESILVAGERLLHNVVYLDGLPCITDQHCPMMYSCSPQPATPSYKICTPIPAPVDPPVDSPVDSPIDPPVGSPIDSPNASPFTPPSCTTPAPIPGAISFYLTCFAPPSAPSTISTAPITFSGSNVMSYWIYPTSLSLGSGQVAESLTLPPNTDLTIQGNLIITPPASNSTVTLTIGAGSVLNVQGCVTFAGTIAVGLNQQQTSSSNGSVDVVTHEGFCNNEPSEFAALQLTAELPQSCQSLPPSNADLAYNSRSLSVVFTLDESNCSNGVTAPMNVPLVVGLVVGLGVALILILIIVVVVYRKYFKKVDQAIKDDIDNDVEAAKAVQMSAMEMNGSKKAKKLRDGETEYAPIAASATSLSAEAAIVTIPAEDLKILHQLGTGSYGVVSLGLHNGQPVAVKRLLHALLSTELDAFFREAGIMCALKPHRNLVRMHGIVVDRESGQYSMVMDFCPRGSLDSLLEKSSAMTEYHQFKVIAGICCGMEALAVQNIVHRDLAARNVLLDEHLFPKVADFGYSRRVDSIEQKGKTDANTGPIPWMPPESIGAREYSEKSDVWAFGATLVEILTGGARPYESKSADLPTFADLALAIRDQGLTPLDDLDQTIQARQLAPVPAWIIPILKACFQQDPADRPTFAELYKMIEEAQPQLFARFETEADTTDAILLDSADTAAEGNFATREYSLIEPDVPERRSLGTKTKSKRKSKMMKSDQIESAGPKFKILGKLGEGSFGVVSLGMLADGQFVAIKQLLGASSEQSSSMYNEAKLMLSMKHHRNVVQVFGLTLEGDKLAIVMEFAALGSLDAFVERSRKTKTVVPAQQLFRFALGIARGMESLAEQKIVHRDLAARNVLLNSNMEPKISDFGMSRAVRQKASSGQTQSNTGPIRWMAPESLGRIYSEKSDVWAYGCVIFELMTGSIPFPDLDLIDIVAKVRDQNETPLSSLSGNLAASIDACPEYLITLMRKCFAYDPEKRPTFAEIVAYLQECAPKEVLNVEAARIKRREKRQKLLKAIDDIVV